MHTSLPQWLLYAIASGMCAALTSSLAKLTTTHLTSTWANTLSQLLALDAPSRAVEVLIRGLFLALNLAFNAVMWSLFTRALTLAASTVQVSVINTGANFFLTAVLGAVIFGEELPALWWLGASLLVAGSVIIGRREEGVAVDRAGAVGGEAAKAQHRSEPDALPVGRSDRVVYDDGTAVRRKPREGSVEAKDDDSVR